MDDTVPNYFARPRPTVAVTATPPLASITAALKHVHSTVVRMLPPVPLYPHSRVHHPVYTKQRPARRLFDTRPLLLFPGTLPSIRTFPSGRGQSPSSFFDTCTPSSFFDTYTPSSFSIRTHRLVFIDCVKFPTAVVAVCREALHQRPYRAFLEL